jgi:threonine synthase
MDFHSTRDPALRAGFSDALRRGLAPDGGLYVPSAWPSLDPSGFGDLSLPGVGERLIGPFAAGDPLAASLGGIVRDAFDFPAPLVDLGSEQGDLKVLELFHGPTAAFKDFGARFLAACFQRMQGGGQRRLHILVATSGDTGGAVAAAFHGRPGIDVSVLFPKGLVSPTQERQLTCWGGNVRSFAVRGTFDDCQRMVKDAFMDEDLRARYELSSANSINLGRLLPQAVYYAASSLAHWRASGERLNFIVPSGNLGNVVACAWARHIGLPIGEIVLAHNANRTVPDFLDSGDWRPRPSVATLASAMDVGNPSNMERLRALYPELAALRAAVRATSIDDAAIRERIRVDFARFGQVWCPHTAVAAEAWARLPEAERRGRSWALVSTASPAKFPEIVEPLIGRAVAVPPALAELLGRPTRCTEIDASLQALRAALAGSN